MVDHQLENKFSLTEFKRAAEVIGSYVNQTPLLYSRILSEKVGKSVYLKLETQQPTNSFKVRPAFLGILSDLAHAQDKGVLTTSSGNFAQAVAYASHVLGVRSCIVMTDDTSTFKVEMTKKWGAEVAFCGLTFESRFEKLKELEEQRKSLVLHGFDSVETILADGTIALEIHEDLKEPFAVICPSSGGGLVSGIAACSKALNSENEIYAAQPENASAIVQSYKAKKRVNIGKAHTIADALVASIPGERTFDLIQKHVTGVVSVTESEILEYLKLLMEAHRFIVEPASAVSVAALLTGKIKTNKRHIVCVLSGANISYDLHYKLICQNAD